MNDACSHVLRSRVCRLILDLWREIVYRRKVLVYNYLIMSLKRTQRMFQSWKLLVLSMCFRRYSDKLKTGSDTHQVATRVLQEWFFHSIELRRKAEAYGRVTQVRHVAKSLRRWKNRWLEKSRLLRRRRRVQIVTESRTLQRALSAWRSMCHSRVRRNPSPLLSRPVTPNLVTTPQLTFDMSRISVGRNESLNSTINSVHRHTLDMTATFPRRCATPTRSLLGLRRKLMN